MKKITKVVAELVGLPGVIIIIALALLNWLVIGCSSEKPSTEVAGGVAVRHSFHDHRKRLGAIFGSGSGRERSGNTAEHDRDRLRRRADQARRPRPQ